MNTLTLISSQKKLRYALFVGRSAKTPLLSGECEDCRGEVQAQNALKEALAAAEEKGVSVSRLSLRVSFGGRLFLEPVFANDKVLAQLETLVAKAPLHLPITLALARACHKIVPKLPLLLAFETSFFGSLPERERSYAIDPKLAEELGLLRCGYHGLYHETAIQTALLFASKKNIKTTKILSICLERLPEITATIRGRPVYVTSGATPLEGLPGEHSSGEIDPFLVTMLAKKLGWGPEQINMMLTRESGLAGLLDETLTLDELLASKERSHRLAKELFKYRVLLACGAGIAAMGGVDAVVFSGRYAKAGRLVAPFLRKRLSQTLINEIPLCLNSEKDMHAILAGIARGSGLLPLP